VEYSISLIIVSDLGLYCNVESFAVFSGVNIHILSQGMPQSWPALVFVLILTRDQNIRELSLDIATKVLKSLRMYTVFDCFFLGYEKSDEDCRTPYRMDRRPRLLVGVFWRGDQMSMD